MVEESSRIWCLQESKLIQLPSSERSWYLRFLLFPVRFWSSCQTLKRLLKWSKFTVSCLRSSKRLSCRRSRSNRTSAFKHLWVFLSSAAFLWSTPNYLFFKYQFNEILIQLVYFDTGGALQLADERAEPLGKFLIVTWLWKKKLSWS